MTMIMLMMKGGGRVVDVAEGATSSVSKYSARNPRSGENDE